VLPELFAALAALAAGLPAAALAATPMGIALPEAGLPPPVMELPPVNAGSLGSGTLVPGLPVALLALPVFEAPSAVVIVVRPVLPVLPALPVDALDVEGVGAGAPLVLAADMPMPLPAVEPPGFVPPVRLPALPAFETSPVVALGSPPVCAPELISPWRLPALPAFEASPAVGAPPVLTPSIVALGTGAAVPPVEFVGLTSTFEAPPALQALPMSPLGMPPDLLLVVFVAVAAGAGAPSFPVFVPMVPALGLAPPVLGAKAGAAPMFAPGFISPGRLPALPAVLVAPPVAGFVLALWARRLRLGVFAVEPPVSAVAPGFAGAPLGFPGSLVRAIALRPPVVRFPPAVLVGPPGGAGARAGAP
jgi:hypothetical protein